MPNQATGVLESAAGKRVVLQNLVNGGALSSITPNGVSAGQVFKFTWNGYAYTIARDGTAFGISSTGLDYIGLNNNPMPMHAYSNTGGRYGSFGFTDIGNGYYQVRSFFFPKYCLSTGTTNPVMALCNVNDLSQLFPINSEIKTTSITNYAILSSGNDKVSFSNASGLVGHTWSGVFRLVTTSTKKYNNGFVISNNIEKTLQDILTVSAWEKYITDGSPDLNTPEDTNSLISMTNGQYIPNDVVRTLTITIGIIFIAPIFFQ
jgi:hypothetical protein